MRTISRVRQVRVLIYASITLILGWLLLIPAFGQFRDPIGPNPTTHAELASTDAPADDPSDVRLRVVSPAPEGLIIQGNQLKAAPGYVLEKGANNQMIVRRKAGGQDPIITMSCGCHEGTGNCGAEVSGDVAICHRGAVNPCSGACRWESAPTKIGPPRGR